MLMQGKLTGDLGLGHAGQSEPLPGVELPQVGAAPVRRGHRARRRGQTRQRTEEHRDTHLLRVNCKESPLFFYFFYVFTPRSDKNTKKKKKSRRSEVRVRRAGSAQGDPRCRRLVGFVDVWLEFSHPPPPPPPGRTARSSR